MNFLNQLLRGISFIPALVNGIEGLLGGRTGAEKKDAAMGFLENALATVDAVASREIVNPEKFREGISTIIDGTVELSECFDMGQEWNTRTGFWPRFELTLTSKAPS